MIGDYGRETSVFGLSKGYDSVRFYSGRVIHAADLNEESDLQTALREAALVDVIGRVGFPKQGGGFAPSISGAGISLSAGDMYVAGARFVAANPVLVPLADLLAIPDGQQGLIVAQCDKAVTDYLAEPFLRDPGLGGPDTAGRQRPHFRIRVLRLSEVAAANGATEAAFLQVFDDGRFFAIPGQVPRNGRAAFSLDPAHLPADEDCFISEDAAYSGQGNVNYHVEIHTPGPAGTATFKWAREDVRARVAPQGAGRVLVGAPSDDLRRIQTGDTVEVKGANAHAAGQPGVLGTITIAPDGMVTFSAAITAALAGMDAPVMLTRWDHSHAANPGGIPIGAVAVAIEKGVQIAFTGSHLAGDYWMCAARVITGDILWPPRETDAAGGFVPPFNWGPHFAALAAYRHTGPGVTGLVDLRPGFPSLTHLTADDVTVRDTGQCSFAGETVQEALEWLCAQLNQNICTITVRPDTLGPEQAGLMPQLVVLPTLDQALEMLAMVLEKMPAALNGPDNNPFARRIAMVFTGGEYVWPERWLDVFQNMVSVDLSPCASAPVTIRCPGWLTLERCLNVRIAELNMVFSDERAGLSVMGGKAIDLAGLYLRRTFSATSGMLSLAASRRIALTDVRVMIDNVRGYRAYRPAIHLWDALAQTTFDTVSSNGALILGPGVPTPENDPVPDLLSAAASDRISTPYAPVHAGGGAIAPHQSSPTLRLTGCKLMQIIPGQAAMNSITSWALRRPGRAKGFTLIDASYSLALARNLVGPQHPLVNRMRKQRTAAPVDAVERLDVAMEITSTALRVEVQRPFRHIDVDDCELIRGPSVLVAETVTVRNCKFPQYGDAGCVVDGWVRRVVQSLPIGRSEASFLFYGSSGEQADVPRRLRPVLLSVARRTSFEGNLGYPEYGVDHGNPSDELNPWPVLLDFAPRQTTLSAAYDIMQTAHPMLRNKAMFLHADYLGSKPF
jgi:Family of unknown function (DUF6519)